MRFHTVSPIVSQALKRAAATFACASILVNGVWVSQTAQAQTEQIEDAILFIADKQDGDDGDSKQKGKKDKGELKAGKNVEERKWIGVSGQPIDSFYRAELGLPEDSGFGVTVVVPDSPAAKAGVQSLDVILSINGEPVNDPESVAKQIASAPDGKVKIKLRRKGQEVEVDVEPAPMPTELRKATKHRGNFNQEFLDTITGKNAELRDHAEKAKRMKEMLGLVEEKTKASMKEAEARLADEIKQLEHAAAQSAKDAADEQAKAMRQQLEAKRDELMAQRDKIRNEHKMLIEKLREDAGEKIRVRKFGPGEIKVEKLDGQGTQEKHEIELQFDNKMEIKLPKRLKIEINQKDDQPAQLHVETDEGSWDVEATDDLEQLPEEVREHVKGFLGKHQPQAIVIDPEKNNWSELVEMGLQLAPNEKQLEDIEDVLESRLDEVQDQIESHLDNAMEGLHDQVDSMFEQVSGQLDEMREQLDSVRGEAESRVHDVLTEAKNIATEAAHQAKEELHGMTQELRDKAVEQGAHDEAAMAEEASDEAEDEAHAEEHENEADKEYEEDEDDDEDDEDENDDEEEDENDDSEEGGKRDA